MENVANQYLTCIFYIMIQNTQVKRHFIRLAGKEKISKGTYFKELALESSVLKVLRLK